MVLIPIRLLTLPPLLCAPLHCSQARLCVKSCTDTIALKASWKNQIPVFDTVTSPIIILYLGQIKFFFVCFIGLNGSAQAKNLDQVWASTSKNVGCEAHWQNKIYYQSQSITPPYNHSHLEHKKLQFIG